MSPRPSVPKRKRAPDGREKPTSRSRDPLGGGPGISRMKTYKTDLPSIDLLGRGLVSEMSPRPSVPKRKRAPDGHEKPTSRSWDPLGGSPGNFCMKTSKHDLILTDLLGLGLIA